MRLTKKVFAASFSASIPVFLGYLAMGFAAGVLLAGKTKLGVFWGFITSATSISGALQFLLVDWFYNQTALVTVAVVTLSINMRYALYGLPLIDRWRNVNWLLKLYLMLTLTDETFALEVENKVPEGEDSVAYCFGIALLDHIYWILGVSIGTLAGSVIPYNTEGIDFAMTALFIVILLDQLHKKVNRISALIGAVCAVIGLLLYPQNMLIPSVVLILAALMLFRKKAEAANA